MASKMDFGTRKVVKARKEKGEPPDPDETGPGEGAKEFKGKGIVAGGSKKVVHHPAGKATRPIGGGGGEKGGGKDGY